MRTCSQCERLILPDSPSLVAVERVRWMQDPREAPRVCSVYCADRHGGRPGGLIAWRYEAAVEAERGAA